ncbi:DUF6443 domain-containing protein [Flammeovirga sp. SJP92]|uniref:DUF6443 domain-containing protein n=1 Tax=Flammeovirga sp. SJP92 TaxID=1775430 RepID=UPI0007894E51|nr:DUF6443 domain-containing protein [Flammeovirga sp. SJP92]KXX69419.1 hypothetical protein AVL50_19255 [Flammeovirga sp. SJP92]
MSTTLYAQTSGDSSSINKNVAPSLMRIEPPEGPGDGVDPGCSDKIGPLQISRYTCGTTYVIVYGRNGCSYGGYIQPGNISFSTGTNGVSNEIPITSSGSYYIQNYSRQTISTSSKSVTVYKPPTAPTISTSYSINQCNLSISITVNNTITGLAYEVRKLGSSGESFTGDGNSKTVTLTGTGTYKVYVTKPSGNSYCSAETFNKTIATVNPTPLPKTPTLVTTSLAVCNGNNLNVTIGDIVKGVVYKLRKDGQSSDTSVKTASITSNLTFSNLSIGDYTLTATNNCNSSQNKTLHFTVREKGDLSTVELPTYMKEVCVRGGDDIGFIISNASDFSIRTLNVYRDDTFIRGYYSSDLVQIPNGKSILTVENAQPGTYQIQGIPDGCSTTMESPEIEVTAQSETIPTITLNIDNGSSFCENSSSPTFSINEKNNYSGNIQNIVWTIFNRQTLATPVEVDSDDLVNYNFPTPGRYTVIGTLTFANTYSNNNCYSSSTSAHAEIIIDPSFTASTFNPSLNILENCTSTRAEIIFPTEEGKTYTLYRNSQTSQYTTDDFDKISGTGSTVAVTVLHEGDYWVKASWSNSCGTASNFANYAVEVENYRISNTLTQPNGRYIIEGGEFIANVSDYEGKIGWKHSTDGNNWTVIPNTFGTSYSFIPSENKFLKAYIVDCPSKESNPVEVVVINKDVYKPIYFSTKNGERKLYKNNISDDFDFYWQTEENGESTANNAVSINNPSNGIHYLKARHKASGIFLPNAISYEVSSEYYNPDMITQNLTENNTNKTTIYSPQIPFESSDVSTFKNKALTDGVVTVNEFFDGFGKPIQNVVKQGAKTEQGLRDLVTPMAYDKLGRNSKEYLSYVSKESSDGALISNAVSAQATYFNDRTDGEQTSNAFTITKYDDSPLNEMQAISSFGDDWAGKMGVTNEDHSVETNTRPNIYEDKIIKFNYDGEAIVRTITLNNTVTTSETHVAQESIALTDGFTANGTNGTFSAYINNNGVGDSDGFYESGELLITETKDEHKFITAEVKNKFDQLIVKRIQNGVDNNGVVTYSDTYYVYDDFGNLILVLSPKAVANLQASSEISNDVIEELCYQYKYDYRNRQIAKKIPGKEWQYMVYDHWDRLVLSQDGALRSEHNDKWLFTKYDYYNRPIISGKIILTGKSYEDLVSDYDDATLVRFDKYPLADDNNPSLNDPNLNDPKVKGYTDRSMPKLLKTNSSDLLDGVELLSVTYYDHYDWDTDIVFEPKDALFENDTAKGIVKPTKGEVTKGLVTGSITKVLGKEEELKTKVFFDDKYRAIQTVTESLGGGTDRLTQQYRFTGEVIKSYIEHTKIDVDNNMTTVNIKEENIYDELGRIESVVQTVNDEPSRVLVTNEYNELGELIRKTTGTEEQPLIHDYDYNIRGWLTGINQDVNIDKAHPFSFQLRYNNDIVNGVNTLSVEGQYNGNVAKQSWQTFNSPGNRNYEYRYDEQNRLKEAIYEGVGDENYSVTGSDPSEGITYDLNGNILNLKRFGITDLDKKEYGIIDELEYTYNKSGLGNQLTAVRDLATFKPSSFKDDHSFYDGNTSGADYIYDNEGALIEDKNKKITSIEYNFLKLPTKITFDRGEIEYIYDASGIKLQQIDKVDGETKVTDYVGGFVYENNVLQYINNAEGRILTKASGVKSRVEEKDFYYEYHYKDHLGNLRASIRLDEVLKEDFEDATTHFDFETNTIDNFGYGVNGSKSQKLIASSSGVAEGASIEVEVTEGEKLFVSVQSFYSTSSQQTAQQSTTYNTTEGGVVSNGDEGSSTSTTSPINMSAPIATFGTQSTEDPNAYLKVYFLKEDKSIIANSTSTQEVAVGGSHEELLLSLVVPSEAAFVKAQLINESIDVPVYFDDFTLTFDDYIVQENHYYPFGMGMTGLEKKGTPDHKFQYNGKEKMADIGFYDYGARHYEVSLGRWFAIDPHAENYLNISPYTYALDNPIYFIDPDGKDVYGMSIESMQNMYGGNNVEIQINNRPKLPKNIEITIHSATRSEQLNDYILSGANINEILNYINDFEGKGFSEAGLNGPGTQEDSERIAKEKMSSSDGSVVSYKTSGEATMNYVNVKISGYKLEDNGEYTSYTLYDKKDFIETIEEQPGGFLTKNSPGYGNSNTRAGNTEVIDDKNSSPGIAELLSTLVEVGWLNFNKPPEDKKMQYQILKDWHSAENIKPGDTIYYKEVRTGVYMPSKKK